MQFVLGEALAFPAQALQPFDLDRQLGAFLAKLGAESLEDRRHFGHPALRLGLGLDAHRGQQEGAPVHLELGDPRAEIGIRDASFGIHADIFLGDIGQARPARHQARSAA